MNDAFPGSDAARMPSVVSVRHARRPAVAGLLALALVSAPPALGAQSATATLRVQENFRAEPNGPVLGVLEPGASLGVLSRDGRWLEVEAEGWVWMRSLQTVRRDGMDLVVSASGGENLRAEPSGRVLGRLEEGTLLSEGERVPGWIRVRRRGWVWAPSTEVAEEEPAAGTAAPPPGSAAPAADGPSGAASPRYERAGAGGAAILASPDGDTLALARGGAEMPVLARQGSWARVRLDGWVWMPEEAPTDEGGGAMAEAGPARVAADPEGYRGRLVSWELQFVSLERAERIRTEFYEGEPFLLARHQDGLFVYVAVPPDRLGDVEGLIPLERIAVVGRVRVASSDLTGSPILDLVELRRVSRP